VSDSLRLALTFLVACGTTQALTPLAITVAHRTSFYDHPVGYKAHRRATPYMGGVAVVGGMFLSSALFARHADELAAILLGAGVLFALGTIDDRYALGPLLRLLVEIGTAAGLFFAGVGWGLFYSDVLNLVATIVFVIGLVNAYNLMDNMDGASASVAAASGLVLGVLAATLGDVALGAIAWALAGACGGFLRFNLATPSRIFLGDGGSMPLGLVIAAVIMSLPDIGHLSWSVIPVAVVLVGLPALDTTLVVVSRTRRDVGVFTGGRDHLTHRLQPKVGGARHLALVLALTQAILCGIGAALYRLESPSVATAGSLALILVGIAVVALLESPEWASAASESSA
jgi:UDP-GlcNAc:undecaprenyl-phosphate/decaprenyl-phosphate GlcNAc-1-phosphate transferase